MSFAHRNGLARRADLEQDQLLELRGECMAVSRAVTGRSELGWSRQWEYPYVLANLPAVGRRRQVLDAGCGFGCFPFVLADRGFDVHACDRSARVGRRLQRVAARRGRSIRFSSEDLTRTRYPAGRFDDITCISVLEHTRDPVAVVRELGRILKPGGHLLLTFDVSVDGKRQIPVGRARQVIRAMDQSFESVHPFLDKELEQASGCSGTEVILKTEWFRRYAPEMLPWRRISRVGFRNMLHGRLGRPFFNVAVVGVILRKRTGPGGGTSHEQDRHECSAASTPCAGS